MAEYPSRRSLRALHLALHKTTEALASELTSPSSAAPDWSDAEWAVARAAAAIHGVSPLLADALRWPGPAEWRQFLAEQKAHTATRFRRIQQLLQQIDIRAREAGAALVPLKGRRCTRLDSTPRASGRWRMSTCWYGKTNPGEPRRSSARSDFARLTEPGDTGCSRRVPTMWRRH